MSDITLFSYYTTSFSGKGLGRLRDAISCIISEELNGAYEMTMRYPVNGNLADTIENGMIIYAKPNASDGEQPFRIYRITKPINGVFTICAAHLSYDLAGYAVTPFSTSGIASALSGLVSNCMTNDCPFTLASSGITSSAAFAVNTPTSIRSWMGGKEGSLLDVYGGEWHFDKFTATLKNRRGKDKDVKIKYGKNILDYSQEIESGNIYTHVIGFWESEDVVVSGSLIATGTTGTTTRVLSYDTTELFQEQPTSGQIDAAVNNYINAHNMATPVTSIDVDFVQLQGVGEDIELGDRVKVEMSMYGVNVSMRCVSTEWDVIRDRYTKLQLGTVQASLEDTLSELSAQPSANAILAQLRPTSLAPSSVECAGHATSAEVAYWTYPLGAPSTPATASFTGTLIFFGAGVRVAVNNATVNAVAVSPGAIRFSYDLSADGTWTAANDPITVVMTGTLTMTY